jgi:nucleotide-binding universal stress UspA family protein
VKTILWSLDAFPDQLDLHTKTVQWLQVLASGGWKNKLRIIPVYVLSPSQLSLPMEYGLPFIESYRENSEKALRQITSKLKIKGLQKGQVVVDRGSSTTSAAKTLISTAKKEKADLIVLGSHGRKGAKRFFLGSFAETLVLNSMIPVLVVTPQSKLPSQKSKVKKILFPTDLTRGHEIAFNKALKVSQSFGAQLTVMHALVSPVEPLLQSGVQMAGGGWVPVGAFFEKEASKKRKMLEGLEMKMKSEKVDGDILLIQNPTSSTDSIVQKAKKGYDLIFMAAQSGLIASLFLGSITRQVIREATVPIWTARGK